MKETNRKIRKKDNTANANDSLTQKQFKEKRVKSRTWNQIRLEEKAQKSGQTWSGNVSC